VAEIDGAKAATTARAIAEEKRIVSEGCDIWLDAFEEDGKETAGFYVNIFEVPLCAWDYAFNKMNFCNAS
jgi:hypothetical protein